MSSPISFPEIKGAVENWWSNLQTERKCSSTNTVQKLINNASLEIQNQIQLVISHEIESLIEKCYNSKNLIDFQRTCNAINGCFDNFSHALNAVKLSLLKIISYISFGLEECQIKLISRTNQRNAVLELLHSLSRILILVLKLKRTQRVGNTKNNKVCNSGVKELHYFQDFRHLLSILTCKIGHFLMIDDILIDTKTNLSMSGILIREILVPDEDKLKQFHENFMKSIPAVLSNEDSKLNILKFLTCSAIINTWSFNIIDCNSINIYLKFFISLSEKYSSETPIILNTSRTLLLLIKHESFKNFVTSADWKEVEHSITMLLSCIFMLLEHPIACVRHSAKDFLQSLTTHSSLHSIIINSVFKLPTDKRSYFISIGALANEIGSEILIQKNPELPSQLIFALCDPTIVSHVCLALEYLILNDSLAEKNFLKWCETYIVPLLISLVTALPIVAADIEKLLEKAFRKYHNSVIYVIEKWTCPTAEELRYIITALKISQKQGLKLKNSLIPGNEKDKTESYLDEEKDLLNGRLLEHCLHQRDDNIRMSAFSLLIEAHKSTKAYSNGDFKLILYFLKYNLNNEQPSTRQKILGLIRKMLVRFSESKATFLKPYKNKTEQKEKARNCLIYDQFLDSLVTFCFSNIFVGCNFNRLNTVLNILLLCFENVKDMSFDSKKTNFYWSKFLIALDSSYEENKELTVVLANKLNFSVFEAKVESTRLLYNKAFNLCTHMEPPDVLTGSYLLQILMKLPCSREVLSTYFVTDFVFDDVYYYCILILMQKLKEQIQLAKLDLMTAATCGPMYGALFAIRLTFKNVDFSDNTDQINHQLVLREWGKILNELVELCFDMTQIVGCIVNSSSPEKHLPVNFQTDFETVLSEDFSEKCEIKCESIQFSEENKTVELIPIICNNFIEKFQKLESLVVSPDCDTYESFRSLSALLKENQLLIKKMTALNRQDYKLLQDANTEKLFYILENIKMKIESHLERLSNKTSVIEWPATAQVLLLCAWRSIKEASLYLGGLFTRLPIEKEVELGLLTKTTIVRIGEELKLLLCEIKHRGAFEHLYIGFTQLVNSLWKCSDKNLSDLPKQWLEDIICQLESPVSDQKVKLCSTRRSAGLPFLVQGIICSEIVSAKSTASSSLQFVMKSLLKIIKCGVLQNPDSKIHALNVLRALFKHAQLSEHVASYVSKALIVAICGSRAATWSERNSSSLLFSSLVTRIFGVSRSRDEISKKNRMTSRTFFQRYSELYDFLLSEMDLVYSKEYYVDGVYPKPSLYLVLLVLGRLYPPPTEDPENINLSEFLPYINMSRKNPVMKIRELGARALVPLISFDRLVNELDDRFSVLSLMSGICENERHGILMQIKELLCQSREAFENFINKTSEKREITWIEKTKWMLDCPKQISFIVLSSYVTVLHIMFKNFPFSRDKITEIVNRIEFSHLLKLTPAERSVLPGIYLFLERFYFLKADILACQWLDLSHSSEKFIEFFTLTLNSNVSEVQSVPLRISLYVLKESNSVTDFEDDDFTGIGVPLTDLLFFQFEGAVKNVHIKILNNADVLKVLIEPLNKQLKFKSTVIHRLWLSLVSTLVMNDVIFVSHSTSPSNFLNINFAESLIRSGDKNLSTSSLICYAIYLMEAVFIEEQSVPLKNQCVLGNILHEFSNPEANTKERLTVVKILTRCYKSFFEEKMFSDPNLLKICMIPLRLLADDDPEVRLASSELVHRMQELVIKKIPPEKLIIKMKTLNWPHLPLVSLKSQECLLDSYINLLGNENLLYLVVQMLIMAVSSFSDLDEFKNCSKVEFGVFEKGNPNPYCEDLALSDLICQKLDELSSLTDLKFLMWAELNSSLRKFISETFYLSDFEPHSLMELVETLTTIVEETEKLKGEFSLPRLQMRSLRKTLDLPEIF